MFGLFENKQRTIQEVEMVMEKHQEVQKLMLDTQYQRIGIEKKSLTEQDIQKISKAASELYNLLPTVSSKVRSDYIAMLSLKEKDFDFNTFTNVLMTATFITLLEEGKIQPK